MQKLKIAILASDFIRIPPRPRDIPNGSSGAPELIMWKITEEMVKRGHNVTLFASGNSQTSAKLFSLQKISTGTNPNIGRGPHIDFEYALISKCYQMANLGKFDIIHSLFDVRSAFFAPFSKIPTISTLHSPLVGSSRELLKIFPKTQWYVSISNAQRKDLSDLNYIKTIYHGLAINEMPFSQKSKDYYVFIGRVRPEKGVDEAIILAKKMRKKLFILGSSIPSEDYWKKKIKPLIDQKQIIYLGHLKQDKVFQLLKYAEAFLFPIQWNEPFGLVMVEAMACGTPVVAYHKGSIPEIVKNNYSGFIVNNSDEAIKALKNISKIKRENCRKWVENNFSLQKMIDDYEKVYYQVLKKSKK